MTGGAGLVRFGCFVGFAGALLVGTGEGLLQLSTDGNYTDPSYGYLAMVEPQRQTIGHFMSVLAAPLYLIGYWALSRLLAPASRFLAGIFFLAGAYAFVIGTAWLAGRIDLALISHEVASGRQDLVPLLTAMSEHNEPLVNVLRVAMILVSLIWIALIASGRTALPRWMAVFSPALLLAGIFGLYFAAPFAGIYVLPVAMNAGHAVVFGLALATARYDMIHRPASAA